MRELEQYWADLLWHLSEGKASELKALNALGATEFFTQLDAGRRNSKH